ncbi:acyl-CoA dehydratase activase [Fusibacter sp. JL298sf-3]
MMKAIGIDSGSTTTKGVVICGDKIVQTMLLPTSYNPRQTIETVYSTLKGDDDAVVVTTGYGRELLDARSKAVTEITCHAKGARFLAPDVKAVVDIGGQDSKVIALDGDFGVKDFLMNDKCAAGTGRFMEVMMRILHKDLLELDGLIDGVEPEPINSMCAVFAESEIIGLLAEGKERGAIAMGVVDSICKRTANFARRVAVGDKVFFSGGLAQSAVVKGTLEKYLGVPVVTHDMAQFVGAVGAAVIARGDGSFVPRNTK